MLCVATRGFQSTNLSKSTLPETARGFYCLSIKCKLLNFACWLCVVWLLTVALLVLCSSAYCPWALHSSHTDGSLCPCLIPRLHMRTSICWKALLPCWPTLLEDAGTREVLSEPPRLQTCSWTHVAACPGPDTSREYLAHVFASQDTAASQRAGPSFLFPGLPVSAWHLSYRVFLTHASDNLSAHRYTQEGDPHRYGRMVVMRVLFWCPLLPTSAVLDHNRKPDGGMI